MSRSKADRAVLVLLVVLAIATVLRIVQLGDVPPSLDELWSLELSTGRGSVQLELPVNQIVPAPPMTQIDGAPPWHAVWTSLHGVTHPPLYFLTLRGWRELFGGGDGAARALSVLASLTALVLLYDSTRLLTGSRAVALWAAALMALAGPQVEHARLVRNYALLQCLGVLAWWALARMQATSGSSGRPLAWALLVGGSTWALLMTHYFAAGAVVALFAYALIGLRGRARRLAAAAVTAGVLLWLILWGPMLWTHARHFAGHDTTTEFLQRQATGAARVVETVSDVAAVPTRLLVGLPQRNTPWAWVGGVACAALLVIAWRARRGELLLPILWLAGTVGSIALLDLTRSTIHLQAVRYVLLASPGLFVLLAASLPQHWGRTVPAKWFNQSVVPAIAVLICLFDIPRAIQSAELDWRPIAEFLDERTRANDPIVFVGAGQADWFVGYQVMAYCHASRLPPGRPIAQLDPPGADALLTDLRGRGRAWIIHLSSEPLRPDELLPGFEVSPAGVPDFPPIVWELRPHTR